MSYRMMVRFALLVLALTGAGFSTAYHVSPAGLISNPGTSALPFRNIQQAATAMQPGDTCYIHAGTYREWVQPARGGTSEAQRIVYRAASGEAAIIKGSDQITTWTQAGGNVWSATFADSYWGSLNPYTTNVGGAWFSYGGQYHLGEVYFNGEPYEEKTDPASVSSTPKTWYTAYSGTTTTITANFGGGNPNTGLAEVNVRQSVFAPTIINVRYITVDGLTMSHAACQWSPPGSNQQGLLSSYHGAFWTIQNCHITDAKCVGIQCGSNGGYATVDYATDGHNIARKNIIERCGQAGVNGWAEWTAGLVEGNLIQDINPQKHFGGQETAGIKIHSSVDVIIRNNVIRNVFAGDMGASHFGIWLDWSNQGSRITGNVIYGLDQSCFLHEMDHGPQLVDNNVLIGNPNFSMGLQDLSENTVFVHNLIVTAPWAWASDMTRASDYWTPHTTKSAGTKGCSTSNEKVYNNILVEAGSSSVMSATGNVSDYNVEYQGAQIASWGDAHSLVSSFNAGVQLTSLANGVTVSFNATTAPRDVQCPLITRSFIGINPTTNQGIENPDGSAITIDKDLLGTPRDATHPTAGPFEKLVDGLNTLTLIVGPEYGSSATPIRSPLPAPRARSRLGVSYTGHVIHITGTAGECIRITNLKGGVALQTTLDRAGVASVKVPATGFYLVTTGQGVNDVARMVAAW